MKTLLFASALVVLVGCGTTSATYVRSPDTTLGRVVIYRNGVAYFERVAEVEGDSLKLQVPADKVDDFLKSLTVVDAKTGQPAPIAYPTTAPGNATGLIDMKIQLSGSSPHKLRISYVTESPSWKPSYRVTLAEASAAQRTVPSQAGPFDGGIQLLFSESPDHGSDALRVWVPQVGFINFSSTFQLSGGNGTQYKLQRIRTIASGDKPCSLGTP